ncbi:MAG: PP2C family protein-serine/threonine phosphatase [Acidobacteriota bacterium]
MTALSIEDVAATSEDAAVRRRFDTRNLIWLTVLLFFFLVVSFIELGANLVRRTPLDLAISVSNFVLVVLMLFFMRDVYRVKRKGRTEGLWGVSRWIRRHVSATVITYVIVQFGLATAFARRGDWPGWAVTFPFMMLAFRLLVSEAVLLHSVFFTVAAAMGLFLADTPRGEKAPPLIAVGVINIMTLGIELFAARRWRRQITADWSERRLSAQEQLRMRDELRYARAIQMSMLPEAPPQLEWVDLAGVSMPATEVGGDYFDYFPIGDRLAIVSGDVAGHGLASGLVLAALRSGFTLLRDSLHDPAAVLRRLHELIAETTRRRTLVTCAVLLLDRATGRATFASAGHPPVIARRDGTVEAIELFAPPLGVRLPVRIPQREVPFAAGDLFVLHTDGVYESVSPNGESYGIERIEAVVRESGDASAAEVRDALIQDVERFRGGGAQTDDVTVVVARIISPSS